MTPSREGEIGFNDLKRDHPEIEKMIEEHNKKQILEDKIRELAEIIYTAEFESFCQELIRKYNEKVEENRHKLNEKEDAIHFLTSVIDNINKEEGKKTYNRHFWNMYGDELLKIKNREDIKKQIEEIHEISGNLKNISTNLKKALENLREEYRRDYNLVREELF